MPTPPPDPVKEPSSLIELLARAGAVNLVSGLFERLEGYAYGTRSQMPADLDYTDFIEAVRTVRKFCEARPDWTLEVLEHLLKEKK